MAEKPSFEELLLLGALNAVRTLTLEELYAQRDYLIEMDLPDELSEFPKLVLALVIAEKQYQQQFN